MILEHYRDVKLNGSELHKPLLQYVLYQVIFL